MWADVARATNVSRSSLDEESFEKQENHTMMTTFIIPTCIIHPLYAIAWKQEHSSTIDDAYEALGRVCSRYGVYVVDKDVFTCMLFDTTRIHIVGVTKNKNTLPSMSGHWTNDDESWKWDAWLGDVIFEIKRVSEERMDPMMDRDDVYERMDFYMGYYLHKDDFMSEDEVSDELDVDHKQDQDESPIVEE